MRIFYTLGISLSLLFATVTVTAQTPSKVAWTAQFKENVKWQRVTASGILVVSTSSALYGVNPGTGEIIWTKKELANLSEVGYNSLVESPFVEVSITGIDKVPVIYLFEPFDGSIVFSSKDLGLNRISQRHLLPNSLTMLIQGYKSGSNNPSIYMIELATGKVLWEKHDDFGMITAFKEVGNDFIVSTLWNVYRINSKTGTISWQQPLDEKAAKQMEQMKALGNLLKQFAENSISPGDVLVDFYPVSGSDNFIIAYEVKSKSKSKDASGKEVETIRYSSGYACREMNTGKNVWAANVEFDGRRGVSIFTKEGLIVCPNAGMNTFVNKVAYSTGEKMWGTKGKGIKVKGGVVGYDWTSAGIILTLSKDLGMNTSGDPTYFMGLMDPQTGALKFENFLKLKGNMKKTEVLNNSVFYATDQEANIVDLTTGKEIHKSIRTGAGLVASTKDKIYVFSPKDKSVFELDKASNGLKQLTTQEIKFQKEEASSVEVINGNIVILGNQNIAMVKPDGSVAFQKYFEAPTEPGIIKALNAANAIRAAYIGAAATMYAGEFAYISSEVKNDQAKQVTAQLSSAYGALGKQGFSYADKYMKAATKRFSATANSPEFVIVLAEGDGKKDNRLINVNKATGEVNVYVSLGKEREPIYQVDNIENQVYYMIAPNKISCYKF